MLPILVLFFNLGTQKFEVPSFHCFPVVQRKENVTYLHTQTHIYFTQSYKERHPSTSENVNETEEHYS